MERFKYLRIEQDKPLQEKCGIVAKYSETYTHQLTRLLRAGGGVQHRGQQGAGIGIFTEDFFDSYAANGLLKEVFTPEIANRFNRPSKIALLHTRYGTEGGYGGGNLQPCIATLDNGDQIAVIHNGQFTGIDSMRYRLDEDVPDDASDTLIFTQLLAQSPGKTIDEKVLSVLGGVHGSFSIAIGTKDALYLARDILGIRPYVLGKLENGWLAASETHALDKAGATPVREIKRGEISKIDKDGLHILREGFDGPGNFCDIEYAYFAMPSSKFPTYEEYNDGDNPERWKSVAKFRETCGRLLAREYPTKNASFAVGVPDSGIFVGTGYANGLNIPYLPFILRDHYDTNGEKRLFQGDDQIEKIDSKVLGKLSIIDDPSVWKDAVVVIGDDSIIRSKVSRQVTQKIWSLGAKEIHWMVGYPPVQDTCHLGVSMRTKEELIAARFSGDTKMIAEDVGATSVNYISSIGFNRAKLQLRDITIPEDPREIFLANGGCGGCVTGLHPISKEGVIYQRQLSDSRI